MSLAPVIQDVIQLTQPYWEHRQQITVTTDVGSAPTVQADASDLRQVLINLVMNAVEAMPGGGTLHIRAYTGGERAIVEITDTGVGIPQDQQQAIFEPLARANRGGSGLGLSVSRQIVEGMGGTLTVSSVPSQGSTFIVSLPLSFSRETYRERGAGSSRTTLVL
jgi:signal transduction histidine kinase